MLCGGHMGDPDDLRCSLDGGADVWSDLERPSGPPSIDERDELALGLRSCRSNRAAKGRGVGRLAVLSSARRVLSVSATARSASPSSVRRRVPSASRCSRIAHGCSGSLGALGFLLRAQSCVLRTCGVGRAYVAAVAVMGPQDDPGDALALRIPRRWPASASARKAGAREPAPVARTERHATGIRTQPANEPRWGGSAWR